ncbi:phage tail tape measure protein (plasmid) [Streptomyces sp. NEAU-sy36]|uniref:phage tail tape measure protein n=1 Tax=unclassified Streptomyces TaxID=2593676 RepID=UPI0015D5D976|nr:MULTISPECIES: phage tail tape measure protein [unclassified Streptomyces]QLJ06717.1 phage tail tape measure protein [Streptomyces sp. NEAU-sy36]
MANWNLSVELRGSGNDLAASLRAAATNARSLGSAARTARTDVKELGTVAQATARHLSTLGREAQTAGRYMTTLGDRSAVVARNLNRYGDAARSANSRLGSLGSSSRTAGQDLRRMSTRIDTAVRDLTRLATSARAADDRLTRVGTGGLAGLSRYRQETSRLGAGLKSLAGMGATLGLALGFHEVLKDGNEYQQSMNSFGAVTGATRAQMIRAGATASQLGNDLKLPGATAADAAEAMVELAKAGFRTDQAISSTRASLVLASAAQVNAADSAKYLGDIMDQFGLGADQAGRAADTLAATANAASGGVTDIYYAMKYAGPVAHGLGVSIQDTAAAVGMLGKAGILGQTAGTTLRGIFANLAAPTPQMIDGLKAMGIEAWDAQGRFKGLRTVIEGLSKAQHDMTQQDFTAAVKKAFGKPAMSGAIALAHQGVASYDALIQAVSQTGAASQIAAAKGKGLAGAMLQLRTQARQTGMTIYQGMAPGLEFLTRGLTTGLADATPAIARFFTYLNDASRLFGPDIAAAARQEFAGIADAAKGLAEPFKELGAQALADFLHVLLNAGSAAIKVLENLAHGAEPVVSAFGDLSGQSGTVASALDIAVTAIDLAATAASALSGVLVPVGHVVGDLVSAFGQLPGPVQQFVLAALLVRRITPAFSGLTTRISSTAGSVRSLASEWNTWRSASGATGATMTRLGAGFAMLESRSSVVSRMATSFRTASASGTGFTGTLRGIGAASASATRSLGAGLLGALGGPWGLAITAATVGLGYLAQRQQQAAQAAAEHQARISSLSSALRESNGVVNESVRSIAAENLMQTKTKDWYGNQQRLVDLARKAKVPFGELVDAYTNQGTSLKELQTRLGDVTKAHTKWMTDAESGAAIKAPDEVGKAAQALSRGLGGVSGDFQKAAADAKAYNEAVNGVSSNTTAYGKLKDAVSALADKTADADSRTRALRDALDLLSGGSVSLQAAQARVNEAITEANDAIASGINKADGYKNALVNANGTLNTTTKNGQRLFDTFNTIADGASNASIAAFEFAQSQKKDMPTSLAAARKEMQTARDAVIKLAESYQIGSTDAAKIADSLGLIPGQVSILLQTKGMDETLAQLLAVKAQFEQVPNAKTIKVEALGEDAKKELEDLGYQIKLIPGTREYKITAPTKAARSELDLLLKKLSETPGGKDINVNARTAGAVMGLEQVQAKIRGTNGKTVTMGALTGSAIAALKGLGFKIAGTKGKTVTITIPTGGPSAAVHTIQGYIDSVHGKTVGVGVYTTEYYKKVQSGNVSSGPQLPKPGHASGGLVRRAAGGPAQYFDQGGYISGPGTPTSDSIYAEFASGARAMVSNTEFVMRAAAVRKYGVTTMNAINRGQLDLPHLAGGGSVTDWRYDPSTGSLYSASDAGQAGHKTKKVKVKVHGKTTTREVDYFDIGAVEKKLKSAAKATQSWNKDLEKVADRVGGDVAEALAAMGEDGMKLAHKMANGSTKYINDMAAALRNLQKTAKASLTDYTRQLGKVNTLNKTFSDNLAKLAAEGYGDLASQLAAQNDQAAQDLAAAAVKDKGKASKANAQAKTANNALTADQVAELVQIIAAISTSKTGIHDVASKTQLGEDEIIDVANKAKTQISKSLGSRATKFLADLGRANKHLSYADGGIRAGLYATQGGIIRFAEPQTHGEAYLPLSPSKRNSAMPVLADVARRFGVGLTDVSSARQVIVHKDAPLVGHLTNNITSGASAMETARLIGSQVSWQMRRARRGGVASRGN